MLRPPRLISFLPRRLLCSQAVSSFQNRVNALATDEEVAAFNKLEKEAKKAKKKGKYVEYVIESKSEPQHKNQEIELANFSAVTLTKSKKQPWEVTVKEPLTFSNILNETPSLSSVFQDGNAKDFLDRAAEVHDEHLEVGKEDVIDWGAAMEAVKHSEHRFPEPMEDKVELMKNPAIAPTFNLATQINYSPTLQRLIDLGTNISKWEAADEGLEIAMMLEFSRDVAPRIQFLVDNGVEPGELGELFTENPKIFAQDMDDLGVRINYLQWRKFGKNAIANIISDSKSKWLNFKVLEIDARLGYIQKDFGLNAKLTREIVTKEPNLVIWEGTPNQIRYNKLALQVDLGFDRNEIKAMVVNNPEIFFAKDTDYLIDIFEVLHNEAGIPHELLAKFPSALTAEAIPTRSRLKFLQKLGRDQFDPTKPNYVSPEVLAVSDDLEFCAKAAKVHVGLYNQFLQTV